MQSSRRYSRLLIALLVSTVLLWAALPATDNFNRAGPGLGANWTDNTGTFQIVSSVDVASNTASLYVFNHWNADTFANDQYSFGTVTATSGGNNIGVSARAATGATATGYIYNCDNGTHYLIKFVSGTDTTLGTAANACTVNDVLRIEANGTSIVGKRNGLNHVGPITDSAITSGFAGLSGWGAGTTPRIDNWEGGNLGAAAAPKRLTLLGVGAFLASMDIGASFTSAVQAQTTFTRLYVVPVVAGVKASRVPKYSADLCAVSCVSMDFGFEPVMLVAGEMDAARDAAVTANADVAALPVNLDVNLTAAQVTAMQTKLEAVNIPAGWVSTALTWRQVIRTVVGMFQFAQRYNSVAGNVRLFGGTVMLDTQFSALPLSLRQDLQTTAQSLGYDTSSLTATSTVRQILKAMADQWGARPIVIGGVTL